MLPWVVRRIRLPLLSMRCPNCRAGSFTTGQGRFRVNANGKLLDVWLLVRCLACDHTSKLAVHERAAVGSFDPAMLDAYLANDPGAVASWLLDPLMARRHRFALDWEGAWRLEVPQAGFDERWPVRIRVHFRDPVPVRRDRLIAQGLGLSRNEVRSRVKCEASLRRSTVAGFTFVLMPRD